MRAAIAVHFKINKNETPKPEIGENSETNTGSKENTDAWR
jgi:hypothetical protein